jgi:hypothetical protein
MGAAMVLPDPGRDPGISCRRVGKCKAFNEGPFN